MTGPVSDLPALPPEAPLEMPEQDFGTRPDRAWPRRFERPGTWMARLIAFGGTATAAWIGFQQMLITFGDNPTPMQIALLVLFVPTFAWVGFSFFATLAGLFAARHRTPEGPGQARLVVVMPIYHEDPSVSMGLLTAMAKEIATEGMADRAEIFVLSDSRDPAVAIAETQAIAAARELSPLPIWYRRRENNIDRKTGNISEFIRRWGGRYDQMVVLDADSIMSGQTIRELSLRMEADPQLALIQTMPMLVGGETIFARLTQFAGRVYGPLIARGWLRGRAMSAISGATTPSSASPHSPKAAGCPACRASRPSAAPSSAMISSRRRRCAARAGRCGWITTFAAAMRAARPRCWTWPPANAVGRRATCNTAACSGCAGCAPSAGCISSSASWAF